MSAPATRAQVGAIHGECARLGFTEAGRDERLTACATLLGLDRLLSTRHLVMGDAGRLLGLLRQIPDRVALDAEVAAVQAGPRAAETAGHRTSLAGALAQAIAIFLAAPNLPRAS